MKSIRDKKHFLWQTIGAVFGVCETMVIGITCFIKCTIAIPFIVLIIIFIHNAPPGAMETGKD